MISIKQKYFVILFVFGFIFFFVYKDLKQYPFYYVYQEIADEVSIENNYLYVNYTKPDNLYEAIWQVKHGYNGSSVYFYNISILDNSSCYGVDKIVLRIHSFYRGTSSGGSRPECWSGNSWIVVGVDSQYGIGGGFSPGDGNNLNDGDYDSYSVYFRGWQSCWGFPFDRCYSARIFEEGMYWFIG